MIKVPSCTQVIVVLLLMIVTAEFPYLEIRPETGVCMLYQVFVNKSLQAHFQEVLYCINLQVLHAASVEPEMYLTCAMRLNLLYLTDALYN